MWPQKAKIYKYYSRGVLQPGLCWHQMVSGDIEDMSAFACGVHTLSVHLTKHIPPSILGNRHLLRIASECAPHQAYCILQVGIEALVTYTPTASRLIIAVVRILHIMNTMKCNAMHSPQGTQLQSGF